MKKNKIAIAAGIVGGFLFLCIAVPIIWLFWGAEIQTKFYTIINTSEARRAANDYIEEKYGFSPKFKYSEPITSRGGNYFFPKIYFDGMEFFADGYSVKVLFAEDVTTVCDNRQFIEIREAIKDHYFEDPSLGSCLDAEISVLNFAEGAGEFCSLYFDGNVPSFVKNSGALMGAAVVYEGYPEKDYRRLLEDKLSALNNDFSAVSAYIYIHNPDMDLPEVQNKFTNPGRVYILPRYEKYLEQIAVGIVTKEGMRVWQTEFYDIDEFTAVSDEQSPISSAADFSFEQVDLSDNTTAFRGRYRYDDISDDDILNIRDEGYFAELSSGSKDDMLLRFDREHYKITDSTVPLMVADGGGLWEGERLYISFGYGPYDSNDDDWYYLDDDYLYLCTSGKLYLDSWSAYIAFADVENGTEN